MALKGDRVQKETVVDKIGENVAERGKLLIKGTAANEVRVQNSLSSGENIAGLLLDDIAQLDLTDRPENLQKNEVDVGELVTLAIEGQYSTDQIPAGVTIVAFEPAYIANSGLISNVQGGLSPELDLQVGVWLTAKDSDGFAKLNLKL